MVDEEVFHKHVENYFETRRNKRYGKDAIKYEVGWIAFLIRDILEREARTFKIRHNYAFLTSEPKWREIMATEFAGRLADHEVCDRIMPYLDYILSPRTYNNRKGMGSSAAIAQVIEDMKEVSKNFTRKSWIIKLDFKGYFPSALWEYAEKCVIKVIDKYIEDKDERDYYRWLTHVCIFANPTANCELRTPRHYWDEHIEPEKSLFNKPYGEGAAIGRLIWQTAMGLYVNDEIKWLNEKCGVRAVCFVDDIVIQVPNKRKAYALSLIPKLRKRLAKKNVRLNEKKFYCQPYYNGLEFLGSHIRPNRIHLNNKTFGNGIAKIREYNKVKHKYSILDNFIASVNSYTGLLKNRNDYKRLKTFKSEIDQEWFKWIEWDEKRKCVVCKKEFSKRERLNIKYHLKLKNNDKRRKNKAAKRAVEQNSRV